MAKVITFGRKYPAHHPKAGQPTFFVEKFNNSYFKHGVQNGNRIIISDRLAEHVFVTYHSEQYNNLKTLIELLGYETPGAFAYNIFFEQKDKPKHHTIRVVKNGKKRWKVGDKFSPRVWGNDINPKTGRSGPYHSKQITIGPDITIVEVHDIELRYSGTYRHIYMDGELFGEINPMDDGKFDVTGDLFTLAANDGLDLPDLMGWFNKPFVGQIICWQPNLYKK